jgi:hypothetical protein
MDTRDENPSLRVVRTDETGREPAGPATEDYWARVQALREDLARLRSA